jgi:predicted RNA-binding protein YlqC (UPF0109 family)
MYDLLVEDLFFYRKLRIKKKFTNIEISLHQYFHSKTNIYAENVIVHKDFVFFFVKAEDFYKAKLYLKNFRRELEKKVIIVRTVNILINLLFGFFPDLYIHDTKIEMDYYQGKKIITVFFLSFEDRGIAIGRKGNYIKAVNEIFEKYVTLESRNPPIIIKCAVLNL